MKRKIACVLLVTLAISMAGCGGKKETPAPAPDNNVETQDPVADSELSAPVETPSGESSQTFEGIRGAALAEMFKEEMGKGSGVEDTVNALAAASGYDCGIMACEEGFLSGFSEEIHGFKSATMFSPYIGTIPFVGYVFETDDPEGLKATLLEKADPAWNICTEAEETVAEVYQNYVFFVMCPGENFQ